MAKKKTEQETPANTELIIVQDALPQELLETVQNSGLELTKAERYAVGYAPFMQEVLTQAGLLKGLDKTDPKDATIAKRISLDLGKVCSRLTDKKKLDKELILVETRLIDGLYNVAESTARLTQSEANLIIDYLPGLERERMAKLSLHRLNELAEFGADKSYLPLDTMTEEQYAALLDDVKLAHAARTENAQREERERVEREEKAAQEQAEREEAKRLRLEEQERELVELKAENERIEAERIEAEKQRVAIRSKLAVQVIKTLASYGFSKTDDGIENKGFNWFIGARHYSEFDNEVEMQEWLAETKGRHALYCEQAEAKAELERQQKAAAEKSDREAEQNRRRELLFGLGLKWDGEQFQYEDINFHWSDVLTYDIAKFDKEFAGAVKRMEQIHADWAAKAKVDQLEKERLARELAERDAYEIQEQQQKERDAKAALLAPDKDKLTILYNTLNEIKMPDVKSEAALAITLMVSIKLSNIRAEFVELAKTMV